MTTSDLAAAIGFPVVILLLVPLRAILVPYLPFTQEELAILDGPTASPFVSVCIIRISQLILFVLDHGVCRGVFIVIKSGHDALVQSPIFRSYTASVKSDD